MGRTKRISVTHPTTSNAKTVQPMTTIKDDNKSNDLLDLFDFNGNDNNQKKSQSNQQGGDLLDDLFDNDASLNVSANNKPRNTMNTLQIDPKLMQQRESRSMQPDALFDVSMFDVCETQKKKVQNTQK